MDFNLYCFGFDRQQEYSNDFDVEDFDFFASEYDGILS
jgi:hypothetical protein